MVGAQGQKGEGHDRASVGMGKCWTHSVVGAQEQKGEGHDRTSVGTGKCWTHSVVGAQEQKGEGHDRTRALTHSGVGAQELRPVLYLPTLWGGGGGHELEVGHGRAQVTRWSAGPTKGGGTIAWIGWGRVSAV